MATQASTNPESTSNSALVRAIHKHYSDTTYHRSSRTVESEKTILCGIPFNRWAMFPTAFMYVSLLCMGGCIRCILISENCRLMHSSLLSPSILASKPFVDPSMPVGHSYSHRPLLL